MNRLTIIAAGVLAGCTTMQSARTLAPGKTQVGVGATRIAPNDQLDDPLYMGELRIAHGVGTGVEIGGHIVRSSGTGTTYSALGVDPKFQLSHSATTWTAFALPVSVGWRDHSLHDMEGANIEVFPTLYLGSKVARNVEAVFAPRFGMARPYSEGSTAYGFGATIGLRFGDHESGSTLHPEVGILHVTDIGLGDVADGVTFITIGIGVTAGD